MAAVLLAALALWQPPVGASFQWQLSGPIDLSVPAQVYDVDLFTTHRSTIRALHARGRRVICYLDAGSWEADRPDSARYPREVVGRPLPRWPGERWLDIRRLDVLAPILRGRLDRCRAKGFDGVEFDNVDGYVNGTGFPLTGADQLRFNRWLAREAHRRGLAAGLKNDPEQARLLEPNFEFALVEECFRHRECAAYGSFVAAGKAVFDVEYSLPRRRFCGEARRLGITALRKRLRLDARRRPC